jgi:hypothetical protein
MGAPTSSLLLQISLQFTDHNSTFDIFIQQHIIGYFRHIDDILIIYVSKIPHIKNVQARFHDIHSVLKYTTEEKIIL